MGITRRQFLTGIGAAGLVAAGAGLTGCSPSAPASGGSGDSAGDAAVNGTSGSLSGDLIPQAYLNPQDYNYRQNTTDFQTLFSPLKIGPLNLNHRMIKSAAGSATYLAGLTDELLQYYVQFAKGGVELIWVEKLPQFELPEIPQSTIEFGKKLVAECAKYGAKLGYQWAEFARIAVGEMTKEDIVAAQEKGVAIAKLVKEMGFVGVEINSAGFNLGEQFLSRYHNVRTDEYGPDSFENRARFVVECIQKIKQACGEDFIVQILINCIEETDNLDNNATLMWLDNAVTEPHNRVTTIEEGIELSKLFEAAGCDAMHLRLGPLGNHPCQFGSDLYFILNGIEGASGYGTQWDFSRHWQGQLIANHSGAGMLINITARYKEALKIPCGTVTYMDPAHAPDFFEKAMAEGKVDFYLMNRPLTVDTEYVNKLKEKRIDEIAPCTRCLHCHIGSNEMNRDMGYCRVNALTQRVMTDKGPKTYELPPVTTPKKVMVIGGGPAGMEAARIAAARGHNVTLYEKNGALGGNLTFAHVVKGPHENLDDLKKYLIRQLEIHGVEVVVNKEVDAAFVNSEAPDAVVLATGALPGEVEVGSNNGNVPILDYAQFMGKDTGENVIVFGSNAQAFDAALWLTVHKKKVTIVTPNPNQDLDKQQSHHAMRFMTSALYSLGVKVFPSSTIKEIRDGEVVISSKLGVDYVIPADSIINAADLRPNKAMLEEINVSEKYAIGDCNEPFNIALAIRAGNDVGRAL
jgi:2,4-dienoyl-CoA reductase-like NADH-dependent reductase (Old Yellow Enzyme family)/thioredoxin reductase